MLLMTAFLAVVISAFWVGLEPWAAYPLGAIPILVHCLVQWRRQKDLLGRVLVISSENPWQLAFFSEVSGLTDRIEVNVTQYWHHFFGLSLGLKLDDRPHNMSRTYLMVVWRQSLSAAVFREVALAAARRIEGADRHSKGDAA